MSERTKIIAERLATFGGHGNYQDRAIAVEAALHLAGYVIVRREPTEAMMRAGSDVEVCHAWSSGGEYVDEESTAAIFRAMIAAQEQKP